MRRAEAMAVLASVRDGEAIILGPGGACGELWTRGHRPPTIYNMELAYATPMSFGVALARPDIEVIAVEGDGSVLAGFPALVTIARLRPPNLVVLILDNGVYGSPTRTLNSTGTQHGASIAAIAVGCGLPEDQVIAVSSTDTLETALRRALGSPGPWLINAELIPDERDYGSPNPGLDLDVVESAIEFRRCLAHSPE